MRCWAEPEGMCETTCHLMWFRVRMMKKTVSTPVTTVITACMRIMRSKPMTPPPTIRAPMTTSATTFVLVPPPQPRRLKTVDVASTAMTMRNVSQPTHNSQEMNEGRRFPRIPKAARLRTMVGAEPRFPAMAMTPQSKKLTVMPIRPTTIACQNEMPKLKT